MQVLSQGLVKDDDLVNGVTTVIRPEGGDTSRGNQCKKHFYFIYFICFTFIYFIIYLFINLILFTLFSFYLLYYF